MRLLLLLWAMLASLGVALTGATAASSPMQASVSIAEEAVASAAVDIVRPANRPTAAVPAHVHAAPPRPVPLYAERRRE